MASPGIGIKKAAARCERVVELGARFEPFAVDVDVHLVGQLFEFGAHLVVLVVDLPEGLAPGALGVYE